MTKRLGKHNSGIERDGTPPHKLIWSFISAVAVLLAYLALIPRISISLGDPVDPDNPFSSRFTVKNDGLMPLNDVFIGIHPQLIVKGTAKVGAPPRKEGDGKDVFTFTTPQWQHLHLGMDEVFTIQISTVLGPIGGLRFPQEGEFTKGDISIIVRYKPWIFPFRQVREFRVELRKESNGKDYWDFVPLAH
jgi:hypothetical protein